MNIIAIDLDKFNLMFCFNNTASQEGISRALVSGGHDTKTIFPHDFQLGSVVRDRQAETLETSDQTII